MKKTFFLSLILGVTTLSAQASSLATVLGSPSGHLNFVRNMLDQRVFINNVAKESRWTTEMYSVMSDQGLRSVTAVEVVDIYGRVPMGELLKGLYTAAQYSGVVFTAVGSDSWGNDQICQAAARHSDIAFVLIAGDTYSRNEEFHCYADNILRVTSLNATFDDVANFAGFGPTVRLAADGVNVRVVDDRGFHSYRSGVNFAGANVAAHLAQYSMAHRRLSGADLIQSFLDEKTVELPELEGKVAGARALLP